MDSLFGQPTLPAIIAALENQAEDPWAGKQLAALRRASPTATIATFDLLRRSEGAAAFGQALAAEIEVNARLVRSHDWLSFARAHLIEKDIEATWQPSSIEAALASPAPRDA